MVTHDLDAQLWKCCFAHRTVTFRSVPGAHVTNTSKFKKRVCEDGILFALLLSGRFVSVWFVCLAICLFVKFTWLVYLFGLAWVT